MSLILLKIVKFLQSRDKLALLPDGRLRHYIQNPDDDNLGLPGEEKSTPLHYDYDQGRYCMEKVMHLDSLNFPFRSD